MPVLRKHLFSSLASAAIVFTLPHAAFAGATGEATEVTETPAATEAPAATATTEEKSSHGNLHVRLLGTGAFTDGDTAQFQQRHRIPDDVSGGIDDFRYTDRIGEDTDLELDGRAIFDNHDYLLRLRLLNEDHGWLDLGYRQFRTWYDGRGGYFPPSNASFQPFDPELGIDRSEAWARGGIVLPSHFKLSLAYRYLAREGTKSSIEWGESTALGLPSPNTRRDIVPAYYDIDEYRHQVEVGVTRETEESKVGAAAQYEYTSFDNRRNAVRNPGQAGLSRALTQRDGSHSDMGGARIYGMRSFGDKLTVSGAYGYNNLSLDLAGSRIYGATFNAPYDPTYPNRQQRDEGFLDLSGETRMRENVGNVAIAATPMDDVQVLGAMRVRSEERNGHAGFDETNVGGSPDFIASQEELKTRSDTDDTSVAEDLEVRYRGVDNLVLYAKGAWEQNRGNLTESEIEAATSTVDLERFSTIDRNRQAYAAGAKYYPTTWLSLSTEYAYRLSDYNYDHRVDSTPNDPASGDRYPAYLVGQEFSTHDFNVRSTFRCPHNVAIVLRYDWLQSTIDTRAAQLDSIESGQIRAHLFGGTITWNPMPWWWTRAGGNYALNTTDISANNYNTPVAPLFTNFDNDFAMVETASGVALDDLTDLDVRYHWFQTRNYRDISAIGMPYGSQSEEHGVFVHLARRIDERMKVGVGYGWFSNDEAFAGGNYDYHVHLVTTSFEFDY